MFFVAFLPQFVHAEAGHVGLQMSLLGLAFGAMAICSDTVWALAPKRLETGWRASRSDWTGSAPAA